MKTNLRILVVDNHYLFLQGVTTSLKTLGFKDIVTSESCDEAYRLIINAKNKNPFDVLITDLGFGQSDNRNMLDSGESLIKTIRQARIKLKILVLSAHSETNRVFNVIENVNPDGYLLKDHCETQEIGFAIQKIMRNERHYSHQIHQKILRRNILGIRLDEVALQILKELPKHPKISNLEGIIKKSNGGDLKLRSIETKLSNLRIDLDANNNADLVLKAKELGLID